MTWTKMGEVPNPLTDANGDPAVGYVLKAYLPGTTTTTPLAIDDAGTQVATLTTNANGAWEASGNEVIPHIDQDCKWGIFATAADAAVNTPFYMGPFDSIDRAATSAASSINYTPAGTGAEQTDVETKLREFVSVKDFGADPTGVSDSTAAIQAAIGAHSKVWFPAGVYLVSAAITLNDNNVLWGVGNDNTQILVTTDIEVFNSDTTTISTAITNVTIEGIYINKTVATATTKYDIHLQNPNICTIKDVHIKSGHGDSDYSNTNVGGIWLDKPSGSTASAYLNRIENCWIQNNSIYLLSITDSKIVGGYIWGHVREFAIKIEGANAGAIAIENVVGLITSKYNGGIWLATAGINQIRITGIEFDGNPLLDTGTGIYSPNSVFAVTITNNTFWGCDYHGIETHDPVGWTIAGNAFWKSNAADNYYDDVRIVGTTFGPNGNTVSGNSFTIDEARTNKGYAIKEVNNGFNPFNNSYVGNGILGSSGYQSPAILVLQSAELIGNSGLNTNTINQVYSFTDITTTASLTVGTTAEIGESASIGTVKTAEQAAVTDGQVHLGDESLLLNTSDIIAAAGTIDLIINTETEAGNPGGFAGTLSVATSRFNFLTQSTRTVYAVVCRGTTATFTPLTTQDGSAGGMTFTLTMTSAGVIRFTDTSGSGSQVAVRMHFSGCKSIS